MGQRILLVNQATLGTIFQPRGKDGAIVLRIAGPDIPADTKMVGFCYVPPIQAFGLVLQSDQWSKLAAAGQVDQVNGVPILPRQSAAANMSITIMAQPASTYPDCAIEGYDLPVASGNDGQPRAESEAVAKEGVASELPGNQPAAK